MNINSQPFWKDEPDLPVKNPMPWMTLFKIYGVILQILIALLPAVIFWFISPILTFVWLGFLVLIYGLSYYQIRRRKVALAQVQEIQNYAIKNVGASQIGSAIHVAGHPLLQREQPVVLALVDEQLSIYSYENATSLDSIPLKSIQSIHTIAYGDDRVPHIDAIDSAAQALQITFLWREQSCTCLFRRMQKVRPIDWYHAIQQKRLHLSS